MGRREAYWEISYFAKQMLAKHEAREQDLVWRGK